MFTGRRRDGGAKWRCLQDVSYFPVGVNAITKFIFEICSKLTLTNIEFYIKEMINSC